LIESDCSSTGITSLDSSSESESDSGSSSICESDFISDSTSRSVSKSVSGSESVSNSSGLEFVLSGLCVLLLSLVWVFFLLLFESRYADVNQLHLIDSGEFETEEQREGEQEEENGGSEGEQGESG